MVFSGFVAELALIMGVYLDGLMTFYREPLYDKEKLL